MGTDSPKRRQRRADGELSRQRILDATAEIAVERGYEGTSIGAVSAKCGLPASSIYWHFKDKDDLIAAVIERSFTAWLSSWKMPVTELSRETLAASAVQRAEMWKDSPDFLRLGLMLALERRPVEPRARALFLKVRRQATEMIAGNLRNLVPKLSQHQANLMAVYMMACTDGLFIANETSTFDIDPVDLFAINGQAIYDIVMRMTQDDVDTYSGAQR